MLIAWRMGFPVVFRQQRPGLHGRPFEVLKFRTMSDETGTDGQPLPDEARLTTLGAVLRRFSLDELPQVFNVLKGEMSLVGPRPLLMEYLPLYSREQMRRHEVRPGITGWTQVNGRNALVMGGQVRPRCLVRGQSVILAGSEDTGHDGRARFLRLGGVEGGLCHDGEVLRYGRQIEPRRRQRDVWNNISSAIAVFGAGGHGKVVVDAIERSDGFVVACVADDRPQPGAALLGHAVIGGREALLARRGGIDSVIVAIGDNRSRLEVAGWLLAQGFVLQSVVHPAATVAPSASIGAGTLIMPGAVVNADSTYRPQCDHQYRRRRRARL
jgi:hypothetical protein